MTSNDLRNELLLGEDSRRQFKQNFQSIDALASEMVAFANAAGGKIFIGVADDGNIVGLADEDIRRLNQLLSNAASQNVRPPIHLETENIRTENGLVLVPRSLRV